MGRKRSMQMLGIGMAVVLLGSATGCKQINATDLMDGMEKNQVAEQDLKKVDDIAVTDFAVRLFQNSMESDKNTMISPISVLSALAMTANGADQETLTQMEATLGMSVDELNQYFYDYMRALPEGEDYKLNLANSIWCKDDETFTVEQDFLQTNADYYGAGIYQAAFDQSTRKDINHWVEENTDGMIQDILDEIPEDAVMYLVNALAFEAEWQHIYEEYQVQDGEFTLEDGIQKDVSFMHSQENRYLEGEAVKGFFKYYADGAYAFAALLPEHGIAVEDYVNTLTGEQLRQMFTEAEETSVNVAIPKFETKSKIEMSEILKKMGMSDAFDAEKADFSKLGTSDDGNIYISRVLHETFISVAEKGTKAGAATAVEMITESAMEQLEEPKKVILDRPFVYMIIDCEHQIPLFIGSMMDVEG